MAQDSNAVMVKYNRMVTQQVRARYMNLALFVKYFSVCNVASRKEKKKQREKERVCARAHSLVGYDTRMVHRRLYKRNVYYVYKYTYSNGHGKRK